MFRKYKIKKATKGATMIEYTLIVSLIGLTLIATCKNIGNTYTNMYTKIVNAVNS